MNAEKPSKAANSTTAQPSTKAAGRGLEYRIALAFGFMSFIPILLLVWAMLNQIDLSVVIILVAFSAFVGYFLIARRMVKSVLTIVDSARAVTSGEKPKTVELTDQNELGELARVFNRITHDLEHKVEELESSRQLVKRLLSRIGTAIVSYEGIDQILSLILENAAGALDAQLGSLLLVDGEKQELYVKMSWSRDGVSSAPGYRPKLGEGVVGWVSREGKPMRSTAKPENLGFTAGSGGEGAVLCVPLKLREHSLGVIAVLRERADKTFTEDDESLLGSLSSQVAVAIENYRLNLDMERTYVETIMALAIAVEAKDPYSAGHSKRVGFYAMHIGKQLGLDAETQRILNDSGVLHDVGKIGIKDEILLKTSALSPEEAKIMQQHAVIGQAIVKPVRSLHKVGDLVHYHHEKFDGSGYPAALKGEQIPLGARILCVADSWDAMVTDRPYRKRLPIEHAKEELRKLAGKQYDPQVVTAFLRFIEEREANKASHSESSLAGNDPSSDIST